MWFVDKDAMRLLEVGSNMESENDWGCVITTGGEIASKKLLEFAVDSDQKMKR